MKTEEDHSEAVTENELALYDETQTTSFEVEMSGLSPDYARWITQMLVSNWVYKVEGDNQRQVLITDIESEISNDNSKLQELKFTYQYTSELPAIELDSFMDDDNEIFAGQYNAPFS